MKKLLIFLPLITLLILPSYSQMIGGQVFLQGYYTEVGISQCGVYGALNPPAGYNGNVGTALGFVADHQMDGWNTGVPNRCGDYFYPGSPYEAWGIEIAGVVYGNYNFLGNCDGAAGAGAIPGGVTFYNGTGGTHEGQWEGDIISGATNLHVCQYTVVPDSELFFSTTVTLKNNGAVPLNNVYYMRHVDPDNEQPNSGSFNTDNTVVENPTGVPNNALCTATGQMYGCFLGMLSTGYPDARAFIGGGVGSFPTLISDTWNGNIGMGYNTTVGSNNGGFDDCMGITHRWTTILPGQSVTFKFYYVLDPSAISNAINSSQDIEVYVNGVLATIQGSATGVGSCAPTSTTDTVELRGLFCANDSIEVDINSTVQYQWTWPVNPDITILDPSGDSALVIPNNIIDSVTYTINGVYNVGPDTSFVVMLLTLVEENPVADFTYDLGCLDKATCFHDQSTTTVGSNIVWYDWDFDEGGLTGHAQDSCVLLQSYNIHNVELIVTTDHGCKDTVVLPVNVLDSIQADFSYLPACRDSNTYFFDQTVYTDTTITNWAWSFGTVPATGSSAQNPAHIYTTVANYNVQLILTNAIGCKDTIVKQIAVNPSPTVLFSATPLMGCAPLEIDFTDLSTADTTDIVTWLWEFGTGATSGAQNPSFTYLTGLDNSFLFYDITLTVTTEYGCQATATVNDYITIAPYPSADFTINIQDPSPLVGHLIQFVDLSHANIVNWQWDFGDGGTSNQQYPDHTYATPDTFTVTLIVINSSGCSDTISHTYIVTEEYNCFIPNAFTVNEDGLNEMFMVYGTGIAGFSMTIFDRWGKEVFHSEDIAKGWNGRAQNGTLYPQGVYAYRVELKDQKGKEYTVLGHVNLIR